MGDQAIVDFPLDEGDRTIRRLKFNGVPAQSLRKDLSGRQHSPLIRQPRPFVGADKPTSIRMMHEMNLFAGGKDSR
jgi:hypothetical protein